MHDVGAAYDLLVVPGYKVPSRRLAYGVKWVFEVPAPHQISGKAENPHVRLVGKIEEPTPPPGRAISTSWTWPAACGSD